MDDPGTMDDPFDHFVDTVTGCGLFQLLLYLVANLTRCGSFWALLYMSYGGYDPGWTCVRLNTTESNTTTAQNLGTSPPEQSTIPSMSNISQLEEVPGTCDIIDSCMEIRFNPESSTVVTEWGLICDKSWISSTITSIQMVGTLIGSLCCGRLADRFGRKISVYLWLVMGSVTNGVAAFSVSWEMFAAVRFFIGISTGANMALGGLYTLEFFNSKWRTINKGIPILSVIVLGFGAVAYVLKDWQHIQLAVAGIQVLSLLTYFWIPESMRWLVVNGKKERAREVAHKICKTNRKPPPSEDDLDFKITDATVEGLKKADSLVLLRKPFLKRVVCGFFIFFSLAILYYGILFGISDFFGNFYLNFIVFALIGMPVFALIPVCGITLGRRLGIFLLLTASGLLALGVVIVFLTVEDEDVKGWTINIMAILTSAIADAAWGLMLVFGSELFPTPIRATAGSVMAIGEGIGGILAPYLLPEDEDLLYVAYLVIVGLCVICCCLTLALPETKDLSMESELAQCDRKPSPRHLAGNHEYKSQPLGNGRSENDGTYLESTHM